MAGVKSFARHPRGAVERARADAWLLRRAMKLAFQKRIQGDTVEQFHRVYYDGALFGDTRASTYCSAYASTSARSICGSTRSCCSSTGPR